MTQKHELRTRQTIDTINHLLDQGITKISVLIRHSERFFSEDAGMEPFMHLTDDGKEFAFDFGTMIRPAPLPQLYSSFLGRCIETAYLIEKGFTQKNHRVLDHNRIQDTLAPFYIKDMETALRQVDEEGSKTFLRKWFDHRIDDRIMEHPEKTSDLLSEFMIDRIKNLQEDRIALCITHDWNIFPLKEFKLGLQHETAGEVGYLDGIIFFEKENNCYITNYQTDPILL